MLIDIEGIDGAGKGTVTAVLYNLMLVEGLNTDTVSFPDYTGSMYGALVGRYLKGDFGDLHPSVRSLLYSMDRFEHKGMLREAAESRSSHLICDRYVASNLAYASRGCPAEEREKVLRDILFTEYDVLQVPRPDLLVILDTPVSLAVQNVAKKAGRAYTDETEDKHEKDTTLLHEARRFYLEELRTKHPPGKLPPLVVTTSEDGKMLPPEQIAGIILSYFLQVLK